MVLNSKHLRGLRRDGKRAARARRGGGGGGGGPSDASNNHDKRGSEEREKGKGLGRVEFLPVEWHTRFKGRLYREGGGDGGGSSDSGARVGGDTNQGDTGKGRKDQRERAHAGTRAPGDAQRPGAREGVPSGSGGGVGVDGGGGRGNGSGGAGGLSIWDITLPRAPTLRAFTNDTLLDILYFMSPEYHQARPRGILEQPERRQQSSPCRRWACAYESSLLWP